MHAARFGTNEANAMSALGRNSLGSRSTLSCEPETKPRMATARRSRPDVEQLEKLLLLSAGLPVMSGATVLDQDQNSVLANDGQLDLGDLSIPTAQVHSLSASSTKVNGA